jgi:hypothetical protein
MLNIDLLSKVAGRLLISMRENKSHPDVRELFENARFMRILSQAIDHEINVPIDLGMGRWLLESNLRDIPELSSLFSTLYLALQGVNIPADRIPL